MINRIHQNINDANREATRGKDLSGTYIPGTLDEALARPNMAFGDRATLKGDQSRFFKRKEGEGIWENVVRRREEGDPLMLGGQSLEYKEIMGERIPYGHKKFKGNQGTAFRH